MTATLRDFAERHRVRVRRDEDGSFHVPGKRGGIFVYSLDPVRFGVVILAETSRRWTYRRRACEAVGMELRQLGDVEGIYHFDPDDEEQARVAIKVAEIHQKRRLSEEQLRRLAEMGKAHRFASEGDGPGGEETALERPRASPTGEDTPNEVMAA